MKKLASFLMLLFAINTQAQCPPSPDIFNSDLSLAVNQKKAYSALLEFSYCARQAYIRANMFDSGSDIQSSYQAKIQRMMDDWNDVDYNFIRTPDDLFITINLADVAYQSVIFHGGNHLATNKLLNRMGHQLMKYVDIEHKAYSLKSFYAIGQIAAVTQDANLQRFLIQKHPEIEMMFSADSNSEPGLFDLYSDLVTKFDEQIIGAGNLVAEVAYE